MRSCPLLCPGVTPSREACQSWRRILRGPQKAGSRAACLSPPRCLPAQPPWRVGGSPTHWGQTLPLPQSPHLSAATPQRVPPTPKHPQWGIGSHGDSHQGGSCQAGRWSSMRAPGSFPAPTHACPLFPPCTPPSSWGGALPVPCCGPPLPQPMPYARVTGASRRAGSIPHCLIASRTWLRLAQGAGGGGPLPAWSCPPSCHLKSIRLPAARGGGGEQGRDDGEPAPPRHHHPCHHVPSPGTVISHHARDTPE